MNTTWHYEYVKKLAKIFYQNLLQSCESLHIKWQKVVREVFLMLDLTADRFAGFCSWIEKWHDYVLLSDLEKKPAAYQMAMLIYTFSSET